jgi:hypothetical protein
MMVPDEGTFAVRAEPAAIETTAATGPPREGTRWLLPTGADLIALAALAIAALPLWFRPARNPGT